MYLISCYRRFKVLVIIVINLFLFPQHISDSSDSSTSTHPGHGGSQAFENSPITNLSQYIKILDGKNLYFDGATFDENNQLSTSHLCFQFVSYQASNYNPKEISFTTIKICNNGILISIICSIILLAVIILIFCRRCTKDLSLEITKSDYTQILVSILGRSKQQQQQPPLHVSCVLSSLEHRNLNYIEEATNQFPPCMLRQLDVFQDVPEISIYKDLEISWDKSLGSGKYGRVYKGKVTRRGREYQSINAEYVAIKELIQEYRTKEQLKQILLEVVIMSQLNSEFIVNLYGVGPYVHPCIVMEYVSGGCLHNFFNRPNDTSLLQKLNILIQIAKGLKYLHSNGIIHHDLKPQNILVDLSNKYSDVPKIKISDFGLSKIIEDSKSASHGDAGTIRYMAPEQINDRVAKSSDIWAFACIMQECLVGQEPWKNQSRAQILFLVTLQKVSPELPELRKQCISADLYQLILKCWNFEKKERPTASQIVVDLERIKNIVQNQIYN